ncbi:hypothetical protein HELRODRAFT_184044 [Helobdella robusta]|uniref:Uncharacterized protein n=1 Tax=Helobdella robusta TaxID=6412 RepID=T1FKH1_HELRO|nr:hypothetical protein HELRODRAFT_184044 [Helobdella robusta]ESO08695.1 hypothetical protein HELRODRAFT_184044 [Helobdella robusta]
MLVMNSCDRNMHFYLHIIALFLLIILHVHERRPIGEHLSTPTHKMADGEEAKRKLLEGSNDIFLCYQQKERKREKKKREWSRISRERENEKLNRKKSRHWLK